MPAISLPIYSESYRPSSNWVKIVLEKQQQLTDLQPLASDLEIRIKETLLIKQVTENLLLSDSQISTESVSNLIQQKENLEQSLIVSNFTSGVNYINTLVESSKEKTKLVITSKLLKELHALIMTGIDEQAGDYRKTLGNSISQGHSPADPEFLSILVDNALDWFSAESFAELHPLEQAWLVHLRIMDLQPFATGNARVARLIASFYAQKADFCPIIIKASEKEIYNYAVSNSLMMITQPGVELLARSVINTYDEILDLIKNSNL